MAVCSVLLFTTSLSNSQTLDPSQVYTTPNLVAPTTTTSGSTWVNGVYQDQLTCWAWGNPGYCGPNAIVRPGGNINFSFGLTDLYQIQTIANALPNSGTGLRVNGFNFGFTAKNGNGWDDGRQDYLAAYVSFYGSNGTQVSNYDYSAYTNKQYNWTTFNFSETFATPYASQDLSTVRYGFVGRDNNFWAGPYGPEVNSVSFSLKYSVDPCAVDVMSSPNCPGYLDKINSLITPTTTPIATTTTPIVSSATSTSQPTTTSTTDTAQPTTSSQPTASAPTQNTTSTTSASATPSATNPQPKVGEVTVSGSPAKTTMSTSQILSIVRNEQTRIGNLETSTVQQAVEQAQSASDKAQQESIAISTNTLQQSSVSASNANNEFKSNSSLYSITTSPQATNQIISNSISPGTTSTFKIQENYNARSEESTKSESARVNGINLVNNFTNQTTPVITVDNVESKTSAVNRSTKDNEIAGGVNISAIATQPKGFENYTNVIPDVAFYAPKEIYRNQKVTDNARAQRLLNGASDSLFQQILDSQYKLGR